MKKLFTSMRCVFIAIPLLLTVWGFALPAQYSNTFVGELPAKRALLDKADPLGQLRAEIRAAGCAAIRDINLPGISAVAAPLYDYTGHVVAVLCALGASGGFDADPQGEIARAICAEAARASASLGYRVA